MFRYRNGRLSFRIRKDLLLALFAAVFLFWRPADISSEDIILTSFFVMLNLFQHLNSREIYS